MTIMPTFLLLLGMMMILGVPQLPRLADFRGVGIALRRAYPIEDAPPQDIIMVTERIR